MFFSSGRAKFGSVTSSVMYHFVLLKIGEEKTDTKLKVT